MEKTNRMYSPGQIACIVISIILMFGPMFIRPPEGLTRSGLQILGIVIGALFLWLGVSVDWTSLFVIFALMTVPDLGVKKVCAGALGSDTVMFLVTSFILSSCLERTGVARRISVWFITGKVSQKGPWFTVFMIFLSVFILSAGLASTATLLIFLPILYELFAQLGYEKGKNEGVPAMLVMGTAVIAQIAQAMTPISHAMTIIGMGTYKSYTDGVMDMFSFMAICIPVGIIVFILWYLLCRFVWKPDTSKLQDIDYDRIKKDSGPIKPEEIVASITYVTVIILWILPGVAKYVLPSLSATFASINQCYPPIIAIIFLNLIQIGGKRVLDYKDAVKNAVPWSTAIFMGAILMLGTALSDKDIGISKYLATVLSPVVGNISPLVFTLVMIALPIVLTNFISNAVTIAIVFAIGMPLAQSVYAGSINPLLLGILMTSGASYAFATPPATPPVAVAADSGWVDTRTLFKWGAAISIITILVFYMVGLPLANALLG